MAGSEIDDSDAATRGIDRLVTFSDAVVAIAITLVALPLVDVAREADSPEAFFADNSFAVLAAALSFAVIGNFWRDHHRMFLRASGYTPGVLRLSFVWLVGIVFLPIATVLNVSSSSGRRLAIGLYVGTMLVTMTVFRVEELLLVRAGLLRTRGALAPTRRDLLGDWVPTILMAIALVVAIAFPDAIGLWALLLLLLGFPINRFVVRRR